MSHTNTEQFNSDHYLGVTSDFDLNTPHQFDDDFEEIDLESPAGRSQLIHEIENLALTCDEVIDPELFAESAVYQLLGQLQMVLATIDEMQLLGHEVTDHQVQTVQDLYDELAEAVERSAVVAVYLGPSRKDMVLEDVSEEGSITISLPKTLPEVSQKETSFIYNSLPDKTPAPAASAVNQRASVRDKTYANVRLQRLIDKIEASEMSMLDVWISDYQSPYKALGDMPFNDLQRLVAAPVNSRAYIEFKVLLEQQNVKYEVFNLWSQQFPEMERLVDQVNDKTFKQVVDEYLSSDFIS